MKKILSILALFTILCTPAFSESVFVPDITTAQAKNAVISYIVGRGWSIKNETEHSVNFYKTEPSHDEQKYQQEELVYKKLKETKEQDESAKEYEEKHPFLSAFDDFVKQPPYWNTSETINLQFYFLENNNGITIQTGTSSAEIKDMITTVFTGHYSYNIKYSIKSDYVKISDTSQTYYANQNKLGQNRKIVKINDKSIREYDKASLKNLLANCTSERIKLETYDKAGIQTFYINRTFTEPTYKQFIQ